MKIIGIILFALALPYIVMMFIPEKKQFQIMESLLKYVKKKQIERQEKVSKLESMVKEAREVKE